MPISVAATLPNPTSDSDPHWKEFSKYLRSQGIVENKAPPIRNYQCLDAANVYVKSSDLNHCLTLRHFGIEGHYADLANDRYGSNLDDYDYEKSLSEIDAEFSSKAYRFDAASTVFKGIFCEPFYEVLQLESAKEDDLVVFHGFLSTSACREKAESFCRGEGGILLVITGLHRVDAIIPENSKVATSPTPSIPEQEVLLNRSTKMKVLRVEKKASRNQIVWLEVV